MALTREEHDLIWRAAHEQRVSVATVVRQAIWRALTPAGDAPPASETGEPRRPRGRPRKHPLPALVCEKIDPGQALPSPLEPSAAGPLPEPEPPPSEPEPEAAKSLMARMCAVAQEAP